MPKFMTLPELAQYLRFTRKTIYGFLKQDSIPAVQIGNKWRFDKHQIDRWLLDRSNRKPVQILVVDDEPLIGQLFEDSLNEPTYQVTTTLSSLEALELIKNRHFDLIFLDLLIPELDGAELFRQIRLENSGVPVVIITGYPDSEIMNRAMEYGPITVLKKPFTGDGILNMLNSFTRGMATKK